MARRLILLLFSLLLPGVLQAAPVAIALHGGAGTLTRDKMTPEQERVYLEILDTAVELGHARLQAGAPGYEVVRQVIRLMEDSPLFNAGFGAVFTWDGRHELDASIMLGESLRAGAVAGVTRVKNPIEAAYAVMEASPHVLLSGSGADTFAEGEGLVWWITNIFRRRKGPGHWNVIALPVWIGFSQVRYSGCGGAGCPRQPHCWHVHWWHDRQALGSHRGFSVDWIRYLCG